MEITARQEDTLPYVCRQCAHEFPALIVLEGGGPWAGEWVLESGEEERCPECGCWGVCLLDLDPDAYWDSASREEGEQTREEWHAELWSEYQAMAR